MSEGTSVDFPVLRPEEEELARLQARLAELKEELADRELDLATRRRELLDFQLRYLAVVGRRLAELDGLMAQIAALRATRDPSLEAARAADASATQARESAEALGDDPDALTFAASEPQREIPEDLKKLYRQVAKTVHPDFAVDDEDRALRERAMAEANAAYTDGDVDRLRSILEDWQSRPEAVSGDGTGAELVRVIRAIAAVEGRLEGLDDELAACGQGSVAELRSEVLDAQAEGRDLLHEMASELDIRITAAREQLEELSRLVMQGND